MAEIHRVWGRRGGRPKGWRKHPPMVPQRVKTTDLHAARMTVQLEPEELAFIYREASLLPRHCGKLRLGRIASVLIQQGIERLRDRYGDEEVDARLNGREVAAPYQREGFH
jgi:hypothetical protein